jgi:hypothetical protein
MTDASPGFVPHPPGTTIPSGRGNRARALSRDASVDRVNTYTQESSRGFPSEGSNPAPQGRYLLCTSPEERPTDSNWHPRFRRMRPPGVRERRPSWSPFPYVMRFGGRGFSGAVPVLGWATLSQHTAGTPQERARSSRRRSSGPGLGNRGYLRSLQDPIGGYDICLRGRHSLYAGRR